MRCPAPHSVTVRYGFGTLLRPLPWRARKAEQIPVQNPDGLDALGIFFYATERYQDKHTHWCQSVDLPQKIWYNNLTENLEFVGACNEPNRINSQERYFTNI